MKPKVVYAALGIGSVVLVFAFLAHKKAQANAVPDLSGYMQSTTPSGYGGVYTGTGGGATDWLPGVSDPHTWTLPNIDLDLTPGYTNNDGSGASYTNLPTTVAPIPQPVYTPTPPPVIQAAPEAPDAGFIGAGGSHYQPVIGGGSILFH